MLLTALLLTSLSTAQAAPESKFQKAVEEMDKIRYALDLFYTDCGRYPTTAEGLQGLVKNTNVNCNNWGPDSYIKKLKDDPWGHRYQYVRDEKFYTLKSLGRDGIEGGVGEDEDILFSQTF